MDKVDVILLIVFLSHEKYNSNASVNSELIVLKSKYHFNLSNNDTTLQLTNSYIFFLFFSSYPLKINSLFLYQHNSSKKTIQWTYLIGPALPHLA